MLGSIKTTLIKNFNERYAAITEVVVVIAITTLAAARSQGRVA